MKSLLLRKWMIVLHWFIIGISIGLLVSMFYWIQGLMSDSKDVRKALRGEVENALGTLQGLILLGLCGRRYCRNLIRSQGIEQNTL